MACYCETLTMTSICLLLLSQARCSNDTAVRHRASACQQIVSDVVKRPRRGSLVTDSPASG